MESYSETDPLFDSSVAGSITVTDTANWNSKLDTITGNETAFNSWDKTSGDDFNGSYNDLTETPVLWDSTYASIKSKPIVISDFIIGFIINKLQSRNI